MNPKRPWEKYSQTPQIEPVEASEPKEALSPEPAQPTAEVVVLPTPENENQTLTALPLVRHWLFAPDRSRRKWRRFEQTITHNGKRLRQRITVGEPDSKISGVLTTRHQRALFVLQALWQAQGGRVARQGNRRVGLVTCSSWELEHALFGAHGGKQKRMARALIHELNAIPVHFEGIPLPDGSIGDLYLTGLVQGALFAGRRGESGKQLGMPWVEITLSPWLLEAWEKEDVKPLNIGVLDQLSSDLAKLLYPKLDWLLAKHERAELALEGLVEKLGLANARMRQQAYRLNKFRPVAAELSGAPLSSGHHLQVTIEPTADGRDNKLVAVRVSLVQ